MRLSGWHRLWFVVCATYFVVVGSFVALEWPVPEKIPHTNEFYEQLDSNFRKKIIPPEQSKEPDSIKDVITVKMPNGHILTLSSKFPEEQLEKVAEEYCKLVQKKSKDNRIKILSFAGLGWLIPCLVIYILGWSVGWIYKGFKGK